MFSFEFSSVLPEQFREDLELLLYFNPLQPAVRDAVARCVDHYGPPEIHVEHGALQVRLGRVPGVQTIFALAVDGDSCQLAGLAMYGRKGDYMGIVHVAVARGFSASTGRRAALAALRLVWAVRSVARRLTGVRYLGLPYPNGRLRRLCHVQPGPGWAFARLQPAQPELSFLLADEPRAAASAVVH